MQEIKGPFCQSCGMPMQKSEDFGTETDVSKSEEYCIFCYLNGEFTQPEITLSEMTDFCAATMADMNILPYEEAEKMLKEFLPNLKRWKA